MCVWQAQQWKQWGKGPLLANLPLLRVIFGASTMGPPVIRGRSARARLDTAERKCMLSLLDEWMGG